uniref:Transmembrane protein n=1 Tax=Davidia involucrata TaxID=16924 RepID=A0A5B7BM91_DAVIN
MQLLLTSDTTTPDYWLNWRVLLCALWVLTPMCIASYIIWKYECLDHSSESDKGGSHQERARFFCDDESWRPCVKEIHPICLLAFRVIAFSLLLGTLILDVVVHGGGIFYYYTQWTFTSVTIYFGLGSLLSIYGCYQHHKMCRAFNVHHVGIDAEQGLYVPLTCGESLDRVRMEKNLDQRGENYVLQTAGIMGHVFQVIFQMNAGAVMLTDSVYWFIIFPFLTIKDYDLNFLTVVTHSLNAIMLLGDTALNCLRFPWFRISYFILWTGVFVIFQWTVHACVSIWWPYPYLDLSRPYAPLWYLLVALLHIPCYGVFALIIEIKHYLLSRWFPQSYQCLR